jgi:hypothetical protein
VLFFLQVNDTFFGIDVHAKIGQEVESQKTGDGGIWHGIVDGSGRVFQLETRKMCGIRARETLAASVLQQHSNIEIESHFGPLEAKRPVLTHSPTSLLEQ